MEQDKDKKQKYVYYSQVGFWYLVFIFILVTITSYSGIVPWLSNQFYNYITQDVQGVAQDMQGQVAGEYTVRMAQTQSPDPKLLTTNVLISSIKQKIKNGEQPWKGQYDAIMVTANKLRDKYNGQTAEPCLSNPSFVSKIRCVGSDGRTGVPPGGEFINFSRSLDNGNVDFKPGYNPLDYNLVYWDGLAGDCLTSYKDAACQSNGYTGWTNVVNYSDYYPIVLALAIVYSDNPSPYVPVLKDYMLAWTNMELSPYPTLLYSNVLRYDSLMMDMMVAYDLTKNYLNLTTTEQQKIEDWMHDVVGDKVYEYYKARFDDVQHNVHNCNNATINLYARLFNDTAKITETEEHTKELLNASMVLTRHGGIFDRSRYNVGFFSNPWNNHNGLQLECMSYVAITAFNNGGVDLFNYKMENRYNDADELDDAYTFYSPAFEWLGTEAYDGSNQYADWFGYHGLIEIGNTFLQNTANQQVLKDNPNFKRVATGLYRHLRFIRYPVLFWGTDVNASASSCFDNTPANTCSTTKPLYCSGGNLVNNCSQCGCPSGQTCQSNGSCITADTTDPTVNGLTLQPRNDPDPIVLNWSVSDNLSLNRVELYRTTQDSSGNCISSGWTEVEQKTVSGTSGSGSFTNTPAAGNYCYGIHAVDTAGNWSAEPDPPGPIKLVKTGTGCTCTAWANGSCGGDGCQANQMSQTRTCPNGCDIETQCVANASCQSNVPPLTPAVPTNLRKSNVQETQMTWLWDYSSNVPSFDINYSIAGTNYTHTNNPGDFNYTVREGTTGAIIFFTIKACNDNGCSAEVSTTTKFAGGSNVPPLTPAVPTNLQPNDLTATSVRWTWNEVTDVDRYEIRFDTYNNIGQTAQTIEATFTVSNGSPNTYHTFWVKACSNNGCSAETTKTVQFRRPPLFDFSNDGEVGMREFSILLSNWGQNNPDVDLNGDAIVNDLDLSMMLSCWGVSTNPACYESATETICDDDIDNDDDGVFDCQDSDCASAPACGGSGGGAAAQ